MRWIIRPFSISVYFYAVFLQQAIITFEVRKKINFLNLNSSNWKVINLLATYYFQDSSLWFSESPWAWEFAKTWVNTQEQRVWDNVQVDKHRNISLAPLSWPDCLETNVRIWRWHHCRCSFKAEHKFIMLWLTKLEGRQDFKSLRYSLCQCSPSLSSNRSIYISSFCPLGSGSC